MDDNKAEAISKDDTHTTPHEDNIGMKADTGVHTEFNEHTGDTKTVADNPVNTPTPTPAANQQRPAFGTPIGGIVGPDGVDHVNKDNSTEVNTNGAAASEVTGVANAPQSTSQAQVVGHTTTGETPGRPEIVSPGMTSFGVDTTQDPPQTTQPEHANNTPYTDTPGFFLPSGVARTQVEVNRQKAPEQRHGLNPAGNPTAHSGQNEVS